MLGATGRVRAAGGGELSSTASRPRGQAAEATVGLQALSEADLQLGLVKAATLPDSIRSLTLAAYQAEVARRQGAVQAAKPAWAQLMIAERRAARRAAVGKLQARAVTLAQ